MLKNVSELFETKYFDRDKNTLFDMDLTTYHTKLTKDLKYIDKHVVTNLRSYMVYVIFTEAKIGNYIIIVDELNGNIRYGTHWNDAHPIVYTVKQCIEEYEKFPSQHLKEFEMWDGDMSIKQSNK